MNTEPTSHPTLADVGDGLGDAIARQFASFCGAILRGPGVTSLRDFTRIVTGQPHPFGNFAIFANPNDLAVRLGTEPLASLSAPSALLFAATPGAGALEYVTRSGFALAHEMPAMAVDIEGLPPQQLPDGYAFDEVDASADAEWCEAFAAGYEIPRPVAQVFGPAAAAAAPGDSVRYFAIRRDGEIVTTSTLFLEGGLAGIYCVSTIPAQRRKGLAAFATAEPLRRAGALGYRTGILQSSEMGEGVYKGLGFETFGGVPLYVRMPA